MALTEERRIGFKKVFWKIFGIGLAVVVLLFFLISIGWIGYLPEIGELQNPINKSATEIYSSDAQLLGRYYKGRDNRVPINYNEIDKDIINALIATEDIRFYKHSGIDLRGLIRAVFGVLTRSNSGGGSTITQQLAKQLYSPGAGNIIERAFQKPIEWVIAVKLERMYSKEEIIAMYLNQFDFLNNAVGIKSASHVYFNSPADKLNIQEAATLVGMCKNPSYFNPLRYNERSSSRRNVVLDQMRKAGFLTENESDSIKKLPLILDYKRVDHKEGLAPYFREYLRKVLTAKKPVKSDYADWQKETYENDKWSWENDPLYGFFEKNKKSDGSKYDIYTDGLKIYTTIDSRMQRYAEEAVDQHMQSIQKQFFREKKGRKYAPFSRDLTTAEVSSIMQSAVNQSERYRKLKKEGAGKEEIDKSFNTKTEMRVFTYNGWVDTVMTPMDSIRYHKHFLRCGFMSMDPADGHVKAYVGGPDFTAFQYDMVTLGRRQIGSTVKPYLYTLCMEEGMSPCDMVLNEPITIMTSSGPWSPRNASSRRIGEMVTLRWGLKESNNWISARLMSQFTPEALVKLMHSFGIKGKIDPVVSLALGPVEVSVAEMVDAYTAFPSRGIRVDPLYVSHIEDANGNIIGSFTPRMEEIFSEETAFKMIYMMRSVIDDGTGSRVRRVYGLTMPMGGKTGTTNNNSDGWFMGYTPKLVSGVWVGGEERSIRFDSMAQGQGAAMALPIWANYMKKVLADKQLGYKVTDDFKVSSEWSSEAGCE
ncbi:MAG TPA: transglycosylase domain-containing protein [Paludibacteraceae bacterium]|nr:transglycosylase domain-containing protein [Paludibacteraceae bacterium]